MRNENGKNQRFKYEFKRQLAFSQVGLNSQIGSQVAPFCNLIHKLRNLKLNLQNDTRVLGDAFAGYENFRKLNSGLANLSFEDFASWPPFSQVEILLCFSPYLVLYGFPPIPLKFLLIFIIQKV